MTSFNRGVHRFSLRNHALNGAAFLVLAGASLMCSSPAEAQQADAGGSGPLKLDEVVVTAQRRTENLQSVPLAVTAVSSADLQAVNATSFADIARVAPSVQIGGQNGNQLVVRGVGQQQPGLFSDEGVSIFVDGVYRPRFQFNSISFSDVARLEMLRGPQGTLYGKNALGGALNIITTTPGHEPRADGEIMYGSRNRLKASLSGDIPLVEDRLSLRLGADYNRQDGYIHNAFLNEDTGNTNYYSVRGTLRYTPSDTLEVLLRADYLKQDQTAPGYITLGGANRTGTNVAAGNRAINSYYRGLTYTTFSNVHTPNNVIDDGVSLTVNWDVGPGTLTSITGYRNFDAVTAVDTDGTPVPARNSGSVYDQSQFTQELRYTGATENKMFQYAFGGFYYAEDGQQDSKTRDGGDTGIFTSFNDTDRHQDVTSYAVFGEVTFRPIERLSLILGGRQTKDEKTVAAQSYSVATGTRVFNVAVSNSASWNAFTPKGTIQYQFSPDIMAYGTVSKGYKAGGYNTSVNFFRTFGPEEMTNYELGIKSELFDGRVRANLTAFQMNYKDIQVNQILVVNTATGQTSPATANAGDARVRGAEAEFQWLITPDFRITEGLGFNDFHYTRLNPGTGIPPGARLPNSTNWTSNTGVEYTLRGIANGDVVLRMDYSFRSRTFFNVENNPLTAQAPYGLLSGRVTYQPAGGRWSAYVYGTNITDEYYKIVGASSAGLASIVPGPPQELGVGLRMSL